MRKFNVNRKMLYTIFAVVLVSIFSLTIAYAALSVTLNITGNAEVVASTWDIHFDNPKVRSGSVHNNLPTISGNTLSFSSNLVDPGDFYEFTVDVVNDGSIDAMIDSISVTPVLTDSQKKYLRYEVTYQNGESISSKQLLKKNTSMPIKVRVEFRNDIPVSDLPSTTTTLNHKVTLVYSQGDNSTSNVINDGAAVAVAYGDINEIGTVVTIGDEQFYTIGTEGDNVKLLAKYNLHVGNVCTDASTCSSIENSTGIQNSSSLGILYNDNSTVYPIVGTTAFSNSVYWYGNSSIMNNNFNAYNSNSLIYSYVENYKFFLESMGAVIFESRIITYDELLIIGCNNASCLSAPEWLYSTSYWVGRCSPAQPNIIFGVYSSGKLGFYNFSSSSIFGVRPVIVISRNSFKDSGHVVFTIVDTDYYLVNGMTWNQWVKTSYGSDYYISNGYVYTSRGYPIVDDNGCVKPDDIIQNEGYYDSGFNGC